MRHAWGAAFVTCLWVSGCGQPTPPNDGVEERENGQSTAIVRATLIDGSGAPPVEDATVVVRDERIVAAGPSADVAVPGDATVFDASGRFLIPGLVDLHNHYGGGREGLERLFALQLEFGVTTARSLGADGPENLAVIADAKAGRIPAPRLYTAGAGFSHPRGMPPGDVIQRPTTTEEARQMVRALAADDVDLIKMWVDATLDGRLAWSFDWNDGKAPIPKISTQIRTALVQEAARHGLPAVAHIYEEADVRQLNSVGVRHFVHTVRDAPVDDGFAEWARRQALSFAPALSKAQDSWFMAEHPEVLEDPTLVRAWGKERVDRMKSAETRAAMLANPQDAQLRKVYARMQRFTGQMHEAGVAIALGSDSGAGNVPFGWGTHHELALLVAAGLTPSQAIRAGTANGAWVLEGDDATFGTISPGMSADLVLLSGDPTVEIGNSRSIERVMRAGRWLGED
ncbi:MAG: amidohydrolase family protein [Gammaproteobacteria bacterium]|nr:amidohydrolase family protein [Gammaproteobacteria bacterium]